MNSSLTSNVLIVLDDYPNDWILHDHEGISLTLQEIQLRFLMIMTMWDNYTLHEQVLRQTHNDDTNWIFLE